MYTLLKQRTGITSMYTILKQRTGINSMYTILKQRAGSTPCTPYSNIGQGPPPCTPYSNRGQGSPPCTPYSNRGQESPSCTPYSSRGTCLGHVSRMEDGKIPKDLVSGELTTKTRPTGRPQQHLQDICKHVTAVAINTDTWEALAFNRCTRRQKVQKGLSSYEDTLMQPTQHIKKAHRKPHT